MDDFPTVSFYLVLSLQASKVHPCLLLNTYFPPLILSASFFSVEGQKILGYDHSPHFHLLTMVRSLSKSPVAEGCLRLIM